MSNKSAIALMFWLHFAFSLVSHLLAPVMVGGVIKVLWGSALGFWLSGLVLGATFFSVTYIVNHVTNNNGHCVLTALENHYRRLENMPEIGDFLPRFYKKCSQLIRRSK